jgi:hypothetical protein
MTDRERAVAEANNQQRNMSDNEVRSLWVSWGNPSNDDVEHIREHLTNHFYDEIVGYGEIVEREVQK